MNKEYWQRIQGLFHQALDLDEAARSEFLDRTCAGDEALRAEVESLLAAAPDATTFFGASAGAAEDDDHSGERIGAYRLVQRLGAGGMGVVYLAERADGEFEQRVAIKLVKSPLLSPDILERFRAEREILAQLEHPNIARLLDGGTTELGQPYLVMEYVEGEPIHRYCEKHNPNTRARLKLFMEVCAAVAYAHGRLIVHRDLKPGNILVTESGTPKLLDFGIARLLTEPGGASGGAVNPGLTPEYASPEQVRGEPVGTASDIYSLGILLYQLLTGDAPYRFGNTTMEEIRRVVCETPPTRPSVAEIQRRAPAPERLRRELAGDLDAVVMHALDKSPDGRYRSVERLSDDIGRHLEYRPVCARPASAGYVAGRFVRRHRASVTTAASAVLAVIAGALMAVWGMLQAQTERDRAELEALRAEQTSAFVMSMLGSINPEYARGADTELMRRVLEDAEARAPDELAKYPAVLGDIQYLIGEVYYQIGEYERAREPLTRAAELAAETPRQPRYLKSNIRLAEVDGMKPDLESSLERIDRVLAQLAEHTAPDDELRLWSLTVKLSVLIEMGRFEEAESVAHELLEASGSTDDWAVVNHRLAGLRLLAVLRIRTGQLEESYRLFEQARNEALEWDDPTVDTHVAAALTGMGWALVQQEQYARAEPAMREVIELVEPVYGPDHPGMQMYLNNLGAVLKYQGKVGEAVPLLERSLNIAKDVFGPEHPRVLRTMYNLGDALREQGDATASIELLRRAMAVADKSLPPNHELHAIIRSGLGQSEFALGNLSVASELLSESVSRLTELFGPEHARTVKASEALVAAEAGMAEQRGDK